MLIIWFGQISGATFGAFISWLGQQKANINTDKNGPQMNQLYPGIALLCPRIENYNNNTACQPEYYLGMFIIEFLMTFVFVNVILSIKYHNGANDLLINALAIGLTLFGVISISGGISGGCINPAVGLVQTIFQNIVFKSYPYTWKGPAGALKFNAIGYASIWTYIFAPAFGGIVAGLFCHVNGWAIKSLE